MKDKRIKEMTIFSMLCAIILIMALVPFLGMIPIIPGVASATIIHIPVLIGCFILSRKYGFGLGLVFGLSSLVLSYLRPQTVMDPYFQNPLISVLPRVLFGLLAGCVYHLLVKASKGKGKIAIVSLLSFVCTIFHTVSVASCCYFFAKNQMISGGFLSKDSTLFSAIGLFILSGVLEATVAAVLVTPILATLDKVMNKDEKKEIVNE